MTHGPSGRPPPDGFPETRGSRIGAEQERERARKRYGVGKSSKQRSIEKRNRKNRNKQQRRQRSADGASRSQPIMEQQNLPEPETNSSGRTARDGAPFPEEKAEALRAACAVHTRSTIVNWLIENFYSTRDTKNPPKAARQLIARAIGGDKMSPYVHRVLDRCIAAHPVDRSRQPGVGAIVVDGDLLDERLKKIEAAQAAQADTNERIDRIASLVEKFVSSQTLPEKKAEVRVLHARKRINRIVKATGVAAGDYDLRFERLYAEAQFRWGIRWTKLAADCGIDAEGSGWKLDVAEATGRIEELLAIAIELYGEEAKQSRS